MAAQQPAPTASFAPPAYAPEAAPAPAAAPVGAAPPAGAAPVGAPAAAPPPFRTEPPPPTDLSKEAQETLSHMNPLPEDMDKECEKAAETIDNLINPEKSQLAIPKSILDKAKGLVVMHIVKAAVGFSGRAGTGIAVAKTADGSWSAPLAVAITGAGWGAQMGVLISDLVFVITNEDGIRAFSKGWNCTFGVNVAVALGPIGREGEIDLVLSDLAPVYTYSKSKGVFAGISLEGSVLLQRTSCNEAKYGAGVTGEAILFGQVPRPAGSEVLYQKLADLDAKAAKNAAAAAAKLAPTSAAPDF